MVGPCPPGHQVSVDDTRSVDERSTCRLDVDGKSWVRRAATALEQTSGGETQTSVKKRPPRGTGREEMLEDPTDVAIVAQVLGCPAAGHHHRNIIGGVHV